MEALLAWIYPNRVLVASVSLAIAAVLALVGWRRGWHRVARRHPRTTIFTLGLALAVGLPGTWYLASPLFLRSSLVEPAPIADAVGGPSAEPGRSADSPADSSQPSARGSAEPPGQTPVPASPTPTVVPTPRIVEGRFVGADTFHFAKGTVRLVETAPGRFSVRFEDFSVRNGPDLYVYLSPDSDGYATGAIELGALKATDGSFNYEVPRDVDIDALRSVVIWCRAFSVQFGVASLGG